jgi:hypothetical protein
LIKEKVDKVETIKRNRFKNDKEEWLKKENGSREGKNNKKQLSLLNNEANKETLCQKDKMKHKGENGNEPKEILIEMRKKI